MEGEVDKESIERVGVERMEGDRGKERIEGYGRERGEGGGLGWWR